MFEVATARELTVIVDLERAGGRTTVAKICELVK